MNGYITQRGFHHSNPLINEWMMDLAKSPRIACTTLTAVDDGSVGAGRGTPRLGLEQPA